MSHVCPWPHAKGHVVQQCVKRTKCTQQCTTALLGVLLCASTVNVQGFCSTYSCAHNITSQDHSSLDLCQKLTNVPVDGRSQLKRLSDFFQTELKQWEWKKERVGGDGGGGGGTRGFLYVPATTTDPQPKQKCSDSNPDLSFVASHSGCIYGTMSSRELTSTLLV